MIPTSKPRLVIAGYFGASNIGDETILANEVKALRDHFDLTILSLDPSKTSEEHRVDCARLPLFSKPLEMLQFARTIKKCDAFVLGGGGFIANSLQPFSIYYWLLLISIAKLLKKKVVLFSVGCGPFRDGIHSIIARIGLNSIDLTLLRDSTSEFYLKNQLKTKAPTIVTADMAFLLEDNSSGQTSLTDSIINCAKPLVLFAVCPRFKSPRLDKSKYSRYVTTMAKLADFVLEGINGTPIFLPFDRKDTGFYFDIIERTKHPERMILLSYTADTNAVLGLFKSVDFVIGARYHSILYSLIAGIPVLPIVYHHKSYSIANEIGMPYLVIGDGVEWPAQEIDLEKAKRIIRSVYSNKKEILHAVTSKQDQYKNQARKNISILKKFLETP